MANVERHFEPIVNSSGVWKVLVEVVPTIAKDKARNLLGVLTTQVVGDPGRYLTLKNGERERLALDWLLLGAHALFTEYKWSINPLDAAVAQVIAANFSNVWVWKKSVFNLTRTMSVDIAVELDDQQAKIFAVFKITGSEKIVVSTLCVKPPSEFAYVPCLGEVVWLDDDTIQLTSRSGAETWQASRSLPV